MRVASNALLAEQLVILGMRSNPEPDEAVRGFGRECAVPAAYAR
jgi:hypothetical protein